MSSIFTDELQKLEKKVFYKIKEKKNIDVNAFLMREIATSRS